MLPLRLRPWLLLGLAAFGGCSTPNHPHSVDPPRAPNAGTAGSVDTGPPQALTNSQPWNASAGVPPQALERHPALAAARERASSLSEEAAAAGRLPNPRLSWAEFAEELQTRTGPHVRRLGLRQRLPWPGTLDAQQHVAEAAAKGAAGRTQALVATTALALERAWIERALLARELELQQARVQLLQTLEPIVAARTRAGAGRQDALRLAVELARAEDRLLQLRASTEPSDARLAELLASPGDAPPIEPLRDPDDFVLPPGLEDRVLQQSPQLAPVLARIEEAQARLRLRGKQRRPQFGLGLDWLQVDSAVNPATPGSGQDPFAVLLEVDLPLWTRSDDATEQAATHALRAAHLDLEALQRRLRTECSQVRYAVEDAQRRRHLHRDSLLPLAEESLQLVTSAYRAGEASLLEVLETERLRLDLQVAFARAGADQRLALAQLRALLGDAR